MENFENVPRNENVPRYWRAAKVEGRENLILIGPEGTYHSSRKGISEAVQADQSLTEEEKGKFLENYMSYVPKLEAKYDAETGILPGKTLANLKSSTLCSD